MMRDGLVIVAHRGASALAPENTLAAFQAALDLGVDVIETDVRAGRDGALVLSHDASLARRAGRPEEIADLDGAALGRVVVGTDATGREQYLPTLDALFRLVDGRAGVLLDLKVTPGHEAEIRATIRAAGAEGTTIVGVRSVAALAVWRALAPGVRTLALGRTPDEVWAMAGAGADMVRLWSPWADDAALDRARELGRPVWVMCGAPVAGGVGEATVEELREYRRRGVAGVMLNDPRVGLEANEGGE